MIKRVRDKEPENGFNRGDFDTDRAQPEETRDIPKMMGV